MEKIDWTFKTWLHRFVSVDLPIGDLARDVENDPDFPDEDRLSVLLEHLDEKRVKADVKETLCDAWNFYKASTCEVGTLDELIRRRGSPHQS